MVSIRNALGADVEGCIAVLTELPDYFTSDTHEHVRASMPSDPAWVALDEETEGGIIGFVLAERRYPTAAEITFAAVRPLRRGAGIGTQLVERALHDLTEAGVQLVEVKTLDASAGYEPYVATRSFWERRGFVQIDCIDPLPGWQPGNPSAIYVAALNATR
jgi:GNAT superfamily N-acetyltransferase